MPTRRLGFVSVGWVSFGVSFGQWWGSGEVLGSGGGSRADAKVEAGGSDDQLRDVALRHVRGHLMRGAISGHQRSSEVIRGQQRSSEVISGKCGATSTPWLTRWPRSLEVISGHQRSSAVISVHAP